MRLRTGLYSVQLAVFLLSISTTRCLDPRPSAVIETVTGPVQGEILSTVWNSVDYSSFKAIPYAKPPVGDLRFKPPVSPEPWNAILDATKEANVCPQIDDLSRELVGDEDCLYLNVFTPETKFDGKATLRPVMVWIYGGSFIWGYSKTSLYGPDFFMEEDVVIVSFNYRLGVLGFLFLNHSDALGSAGMKDQTLALQWVQDNIEAFGGDPKRVTIFGESAGGISVGFHALSKKSKDLYQQSILMSASTVGLFTYQTQNEALDAATKLASYMGFKSTDKDDLLNFFLQASAQDLVNATEHMDIVPAILRLPFRPVVENTDLSGETAFMTNCPIVDYQGGNFKHHPIMIGFMRDEALFVLKEFAKPQDVSAYAGNLLDSSSKGLDNDTVPFFDKFSGFLENLKEKISSGIIDDLVKLGTDIAFIGPIDLSQRLIVQHNEHYPVYYYRISYDATKYQMHKVAGVAVDGAAHFDDVGYLFNVKILNAPTDPNYPLNRFRKKIVSLWANFAKYGNPTPNGRYDPLFKAIWVEAGKAGLLFDIDEECTMNGNLIPLEQHLYETLLSRTLPLSSGCKRA